MRTTQLEDENPLDKNLIPGREAKEFARVAKNSQIHLDERGREILDGTPIAPPVGYKQTVPLAQQIREMVRSENLRLAAQESGLETFEEADDFNIDDPDGTAYDPSSPFEIIFEGVPAEAPPAEAPPSKPGEGADTSELTPSPAGS